MPRVPSNTISDVAAAKVTRRNAFSISPSAFPSMGGPLAQAARAMDTAIALEGRRGKREAELELQRGRDNRNRHLQHARDWEAAMGAAAKATDAWNRVMEHRADDEATRRLAEAEKAMTAGTMGQLSPTGDPTGGAFNTPFVPGDPEGNQPGQGASSETGKLAAKVREAAYDGASGRVRYRLDRKFDGVVAPYLRKAQQIDFAAAKKLELDTRMTDAAAAADRAVALNSGLETAHGVVADQAEWVENKVTTLNLGASVADAARKQAVAAMLKAGYRPINNDFDNPQYAGDTQKMYEKMAKDAGEALSVRIVQNHAQAMVAEDIDANVEARKGMCEFIAEGLSDPEAKADAEKAIKTAVKARDARIEHEYQQIERNGRRLSQRIAAGALTDGEAAMAESGYGFDMGNLPEDRRNLVMAEIRDAEDVRAVKGFSDALADAMDGASADSYGDIMRDFDERIKKMGGSPDAKRKARDILIREVVKPWQSEQAKAAKQAHDDWVNKLEAVCEFGQEWSDKQNAFIERLPDDLMDFLAESKKAGALDDTEYARCLRLAMGLRDRRSSLPDARNFDPKLTQGFLTELTGMFGDDFGKMFDVGNRTGNIILSQDYEQGKTTKGAKAMRRHGDLIREAAVVLNQLHEAYEDKAIPPEKLKEAAQSLFESRAGKDFTSWQTYEGMSQARRRMRRDFEILGARRRLGMTDEQMEK